MKKYQMWSFSYLVKAKTGKNVLTGDFEESDEEISIPCFDGYSFFQANGKYYTAKYPKHNELTADQRDEIISYCGYFPYDGEYGVIMGALGKVSECSKEAYLSLVSDSDCVLQSP